MNFNNLIKRLVVFKCLYFFDSSNRVDNVTFLKNFFLDLNKYLLICFELWIDELLYNALTLNFLLFLLFLAPKLFCSLIDEYDVEVLLVLYDDTLFQVVEKLFVADSQYLRLNVVQADLTDAQMDEPSVDRH